MGSFSVKYAGRHIDTLEDRGRQHRQDGTQVQQVGPRTLAGGPQLSHEEHEQEQEGDQGMVQRVLGGLPQRGAIQGTSC